ncbi:broad specificity 5'(3')-nucleotidase and polyphosphatase [Campylobacter blaseri]|uniref:5'-nucleotidase SurE n=1 Tax=Campylobacter blaseri TaxID=2042961 RepID=A0A2P8R149_9BACT|nr:5'/3'-nucleotidase SurE [Campylobacter blaseri]PSM52222.1 5'/3'-nucleotidase SurE [Campylobacter blaseri]PSM53988.1 5'/3'-nucleotidase SurE [Campylobacter blaseri]QKF85425.1 broad specificity 5'(3')-nucleotidase and polyphosphatase [Campylobacter blaseri]
MKEILITNDDGFEALGINELVKTLRDIAHITVVAPSTEKSACAHSLTLTKPLRFISIDDDFYKLDNATPADCIFLALHTLFPNKKPDLIISGINHGANVAEDITYSGTCGAAMEAVLHGIPSLAVSQFYIGNSLEENGFDLACKITIDIVKKIFKDGYPLPPKKFLNLNIPAVSKNDYKGLKAVGAGEKFYTTDAQLNKNPRGLEYYWLGKMNINYDENKNKNTDIKALIDGYASLTPITLNLTDFNELESVEKWLR